MDRGEFVMDFYHHSIDHITYPVDDFESESLVNGLPPHTRKCKGPPYHWKDALWGFGAALLAATVHLRSYHVYTLSYGFGIAVFAARGAKRKYSTLWKKRRMD